MTNPDTAIARARLEQIIRVNGNVSHAQRVSDLEAENARLENLLCVAQEKLTKQEAIIAALQQRLADLEQSAPGQTPVPDRRYHGRPWITPKEAASQAHLKHVQDVYRYLKSGWWQGEQMPGTNRWVVFADQPLSIQGHDNRRRKG